MSVFILAAAANAWAETTTAAVAQTGVAVRTVIAGEGDDPARVVAAMTPDTTIVLASAAVPLALIAAVYAPPVGQASRKIVDIDDADGAAGLFAIADMLIVTPPAVADVLGLATAPGDVRALLPVQPLLVRHNQGFVVRFPGSGAAAVWADRTMFVATRDDGDPPGARARFSATIAAAVAQKIGPEPALTMALAAAAGVPA